MEAAKMGFNNMRPASKFNQLKSSGSSDTVFSHRHMGFDTDVETLLADVGYNVKSSDLPHVAQRLEQLDSLFAGQDANFLSHHLSSEAIHYNPSDLVGWLDCMIGELGPTSVEGGNGTNDVADGLFQPLHYAVEEDYGVFNSMGSCTMDEDSSSQQLNTRGPYFSMPKESEMSMVMHPSIQNTPSISQLIKDAIGHHGVSSSVHGSRHHTKESSCMVLLDEEMRDLQQYKIVEDQVSSNRIDSFYQTNVRDRTQETFSGGYSGGYTGQQGPIPKSNSMPSLHLQRSMSHQSTPLQPAAAQERTYSQLVHPQVMQPHKVKPAIAPLSSQSSNGRAPLQENQHGHHHRRQHQQKQKLEVKSQEVKIKASSSPSTVSTSSPMSASKENSSVHDKETSYEHSQHQPNKVCHGQQHASCQQPADTYGDAHDDGAQESGIRLVHLLMACAEAIQNNELAAGLDMVREIKRLASSNSGAMGKVANHFVEALARRIYGVSIEDWASLSQADTLSELLYVNFYEACPYLKFAHFTANQAILEAFEGYKFVHVIDFNLMQGLQWPALIQALALRPGGPPHLRMTGVGPPQPDNKDVLQEIGMKLAQLARSVNVKFSFRGVVATKLDDVKPWMFEVKQGEAIAVNSILQLHRLLYGASTGSTTVAPIDEVLKSIKSLSPKIVTLVEQEANHNSPVFLERFVEALHYYCTMFDSLEACFLHPQCPEMACTDMYLGREIVNIVACEGLARIERHEPLSQWRQRMLNAGFGPLHLGSNAFKQASMLLKLFSGDGYTVEETKGCLTLGWHSRPLIAASAWQCG